MPLLRVQLTERLDEQATTMLLKNLSRAVAQGLGKPEAYVMVVLEPTTTMLMAGAPGPAALVEVRSVGSISGDQAERISATLSELLSRVGVPADRIYANFTGVPGAMWGHGPSTFG